MKKVMVYLLMVLLLVSASFPAAQAEIRAEVVQERTAYPIYELYELYGIVVWGSKDGFALTDIFGNPVSERYAYIHTAPSGLPFFEANMGTDPINDSVVLDLQGNVISEDQYGSIVWLSEKWYAGLVLEAVTDDSYEFVANGLRYGIQRADLYYQGNRVASLSREEYGSPDANGNYLYMDYNMLQKRGIEGVYYRDGSFVEKPYTNEYDSELWHAGTDQQAFVPGCTLTKEEVQDYLLYDGQGNVLDLQGNVVLYLPEKPQVFRPQTLTVYGGKYFIIDAVVAEGDYLCDLEKGILYNAQQFYGVETMAQSGYVLCQSADNVLSYVDVSGEVTAPDFATNASHRTHSLFQWLENNDTGKFTVFTALEGKLTEEYDDVYDALYCYAKVFPVQKDGKWGAIDLYGNTVIDFEHKLLNICSDTSYAIGQKMDTETLILYRLTDVNQTEADIPAEEDAEAANLEGKVQRLEDKAARTMYKAAPLLDECAVLADKLATLEAQKAACEADLAYLDAEIAVLQAEMVEQQADGMDDINALLTNREAVEEELACCREEIININTEMEALQANIDTFSAEAAAYLTEANELRMQAKNMLPAEEEAHPEEESNIWHCDTCDRENDMNFCPGCGAKKPVKLVCAGCGYEPEAQDFRFCPQCGQQFN